MKICEQQSEIEMRHLPAVNRFKRYGCYGVRVGVENFFFDQSIGIDDTNTFQLKFFI